MKRISDKGMGKIIIWWVGLNWGRGVFYWARWLAAPRALSISPKVEDKN